MQSNMTWVPTYLFSLPALGGVTAHGLGLGDVLPSGGSLQLHQGGWGHLAVQLEGEVSEHTHGVLHTLWQRWR